MEHTGSVMLEEEYQLEYFRSHGLGRKVCRKCGAAFWTLNPDLDICGDAPCATYNFIRSPVFEHNSLDEIR